MRNYDDITVVDAFVNHLKINGHPNLRIDRIPDKERVKGDKKQEIDAVAGHFAIEHTSVDAVNNQTRDSAWFLEVVDGLETELSPQLSYLLRISLPYEGIQRGQNWSSIRKALKDWILYFSSILTDGTHVMDNVMDIPFQFHVEKESDATPGLIFIRSAPKGTAFLNRLRAHLHRKAEN